MIIHYWPWSLTPDSVCWMCEEHDGPLATHTVARCSWDGMVHHIRSAHHAEWMELEPMGTARELIERIANHTVKLV